METVLRGKWRFWRDRGCQNALICSIRCE